MGFPSCIFAQIWGELDQSVWAMTMREALATAGKAHGYTGKDPMPSAWMSVPPSTQPTILRRCSGSRSSSSYRNAAASARTGAGAVPHVLHAATKARPIRSVRSKFWRRRCSLWRGCRPRSGPQGPGAQMQKSPSRVSGGVWPRWGRMSIDWSRGGWSLRFPAHGCFIVWTLHV